MHFLDEGCTFMGGAAIALGGLQFHWGGVNFIEFLHFHDLAAFSPRGGALSPGWLLFPC